MTRKLKRTIAAVLLLALVSPVAAWFAMAKSDAYAEAERFSASSPILREAVGAPAITRLAYWGSSLNVAGGSGRAELELVVEGPKGKGSVYFEIVKHGVWEVALARWVPNNGFPVVLTDRSKLNCFSHRPARCPN